MRIVEERQPISDTIRSRTRDLLRPLSPIQQIAVAAATYAFLFTIVSDLITLFRSPLVSIWAIVGFPFALALTSFGVILPSYITLRFYSIVRECIEQMREPLLRTPTIVASVLFGIGALIVPGLLIIVLTITEFIFPITVLPFVTATAAFLWMYVGEGTLQHIPAGRRRALIALFMILILSIRYMDWNTRKPFTRHLFQVQRGMTGTEVERIMGSHLKNWVQPDEEHYVHLDPTFTGEVWYRHTTKAWGNADWGKVVMKGGRAVDAEICLCD